MIDVEFVTLGIIRRNIEDSGVIVFEHLEGNRKLFDSSQCFMVFLLVFFCSGYLTIPIKSKTCY